MTGTEHHKWLVFTSLELSQRQYLRNSCDYTLYVCDVDHVGHAWSAGSGILCGGVCLSTHTHSRRYISRGLSDDVGTVT